MTTLVKLDGTVVAVAGPNRYYLSPALAARPQGDATRKLVALMCTYAHRVQLHGTPGEYTDGRAEAFARLVLDLTRTEERT